MKLEVNFYPVQAKQLKKTPSFYSQIVGKSLRAAERYGRCPAISALFI